MVDYKKVRAKQREWRESSVSTATTLIPTTTKLKPDFGHYYVENNLSGNFFVSLENPFVIWTKVETYINFEMFGCIGTIIIDGLAKSTAESFMTNGFSAQIKPSISERYQSQDKGEWIIPFRIIEFIN